MSDNHRPQLTPEIELVIDRIAAKAASDAVERAFRGLGLDITDPAALRAWHADQGWTRNAREGVGKLSLSVKTTIVGSLVTAVLYLIWRAVQAGAGPN